MMKKVLLFISILLIFSNNAYALGGKSEIVIDMDSGRILYENDANKKRLIASITKVMTALIAIENKNLDDKVTIGNEVLSMYGTNIYIEVGEIMSLRDLLYGLILRSGNDAAIFTLMNQATKEPLVIVRIPVYVIGKPVYLLQYDLRGGDNAPTRHLLAYGSRITDTVPTRDHYTFAGWTDNPETNVICYSPGSTFKGKKDMTLYAVWGPQLPENVLRLPESTVNIACDTFAGAGIQAVVIHENCERVGSHAFADNEKLTVVVFLGNHTIISVDAFDGCQSLLIYGKSGSTADTFATSNNSYTFYPLD